MMVYISDLSYYENMMYPERIIIKMPNWLGDLVMATPVLADLRHRWPKAHITVMCQSNLSSVLQHDPNINEIFSYKKPSGWIPHQHHWAIIDSLKQGKFDLGILLTNSFSSAWWFWLAGIKERIGYATNLRSLFLTKSIPFPKNKETQHLVLTYKQLLEPIGISRTESDPTLYISSDEKRAANELLIGCGIDIQKNIVVGINPGAAYGSAKCWLPDRFRSLTYKLLENPKVFVLYFGDPAGAVLVHDICKDMPERVIDLSGKTTLRELITLISKCSIFLTNDSGPMHIAAALKVPLLALFGSTSDIKTGPYGSGRVIHKHVECSPCYKRVCPIDFRCMKRIEVEEVYNALQDILRNKLYDRE